MITSVQTEILEFDRAEGTPEKRRLSPLQFTKNDQDRSNQGNLIQGKAQLALNNWKNQLVDQREDSLTSLE